jgi:hypothetical protein
MKTIHINAHALRRNNSLPEDKKEPVFELTDKDGKRTWSDGFRIEGPCEVIHRPRDPLPCGARVWIEVEDHITVGSEL